MNNRISFAVDADSVSLKSIYKKDFLELQMRAISTANPNLNGSWFTKESLEDAIESCKNKPILGYFNSEGDFESHNGIWRKDIETGVDYWDTKNGEQILGIIRENDNIKVVEGSDGLYWLCLSCALWTQYNFKQVKRLIKDAKRAKDTGGVTKNISVEIDILEGESQENGVYRIDKFKLAGITILGSKQGKQIEPGIANAALSIPEIMGTDFYARQQNVLRAAYARLDHNDNGNNEEDILSMAEQEKEMLKAEENTNNIDETCESHQNCDCDHDNSEDNQNATYEDDKGENKKDVCEKCGQNPCVCSAEFEADCDNNKNDEYADKAKAEDEDNKIKDDIEDVEEDDKNKKDEYSIEQEKAEEQLSDESVSKEIHDIGWLIMQMHYNLDEINDSIEYYTYLSKEYPEMVPNNDYIISVLSRVLKAQQRIEGTLGGLLNKIAGEISEDDRIYEKKLTEYDEIEDLISKYENEVSCNAKLQEEKEQLSKDLESCNIEKTEFEKQISEYKHAEFMATVNDLLTHSQIDEKVATEIFEACKNGSITNYDDVKVKVALNVFEAQQKSENTQTKTSFYTPVNQPNVQAAFEAKAEKSQKRDSWTIMREYCGKK